MALANHKGHGKYVANHWKLEVISCNWSRRENEREGVTICLGFPSDWMTKSRELLSQSDHLALDKTSLKNMYNCSFWKII